MTNAESRPRLYALVAGEASGDVLGAGLIRAIKKRDPQAEFIGIGGPKMAAEGFSSLFPMDQLSVMGLMEVVSHLIPILQLRRHLIQKLLAARPDVMIGIDAPDFNLTVERRLKQAGIPVLHYVSPSVWAWREGRMKTIAASCDEVLALLPFEKDFYDRKGMPCTYVGHTLAADIPLDVDQDEARAAVELYKNSIDPINPSRTKVMGILAGSRKGELTRMVPIFAQAARLIRQKLPDVVFVSAAVNEDKALLLKDLWLEHAPGLSLTIYVGRSREVIASTDAVLLTCGTVAFEAMLLKRPMAVAYKVNAVSAMIARRLLKVDMFSLPNLLSGRRLVAEYIQENCTPQNLAMEMLKLLQSDNLLLKKEFRHLHQCLIMDSDNIAASAVLARMQRGQEAAQAEAPAGAEAEAEAVTAAGAAADAASAPAAIETAGGAAKASAAAPGEPGAAGRVAAIEPAAAAVADHGTGLNIHKAAPARTAPENAVAAAAAAATGQNKAARPAKKTARGAGRAAKSADTAAAAAVRRHIEPDFDVFKAADSIRGS